jgi:Uma2 family endonuclease
VEKTAIVIPMLVQTQHRFSVKDYYRMAETGVLRPDARVELLDGRIIDMSPIGPFHGGLVKRMSRLFQLKAQGRWTVSTQDPLHLDDYSEPEPDIMLLKPAADDYTSRHPRPGDVFLLVEVSDSTLAYDREEKLPAYARAGVPEVWIVNLNEQTMEIYWEPGFTGYGGKIILHRGQQARPRAFPDLAVDLAELLKR